MIKPIKSLLSLWKQHILWFIICLFSYLIVQLPIGFQRGIGRWLGRCAMRLIPHRKAIAATNIALCFPEKNDEERMQLVRSSFESVGMGMMEALMAWFMPDWRIRRIPMHVSGLEYLDQAKQKGRGALLLSAHFTCLELIGRLMSQCCEFDTLYRQHENLYFESIMTRSRRHYIQHVIVREDVRTLLKRLKKNAMVWYAPDQDFGLRNAVFAPFFNVQAATTLATSRIVKLSDAAVVPVAFYRVGKTYHIEISPAIEQFPSQDDVADATRLNELFEPVIRRHAAQYLWQHRRFKNRPPGESSVYCR